eukprot:1154979-Pelagomonas_calceolata.AAC.2
MDGWMDGWLGCDVKERGQMYEQLYEWCLAYGCRMRCKKAQQGYDVKERGKVTVRLRKIGDYLRRHKKLEHPQITVIPKARIPIIKVCTACLPRFRCSHSPCTCITRVRASCQHRVQ